MIEYVIDSCAWSIIWFLLGVIVGYLFAQSNAGRRM